MLELNDTKRMRNLRFLIFIWGEPVLGILRNLLDDNAKEIKRLSKKVEIINSLEDEIRKLSDGALASKLPNSREAGERSQSG